jgi:tetraacyldisaccharide 4'-kinase
MISQKFIQRHLKRLSIISILLLPLSFIFALIQIQRRLYNNIHLGKKADINIISIGNITAGGSGKTPFTIFLAKHLQSQGKNIAVSHRGYKGEYEFDNRIISDFSAPLPSAERAGDEAELLAEKLPGIPVCAGKDRWKSIQMLIHAFPELDMIILDDSFQNFKVQHDLDFVIFKLPKPAGNGLVMPAGILREPLSALKDADLIVINGKGDIPAFLSKYNTKLLQGYCRSQGIFQNNLTKLDLNNLIDKRIGLVSGIADPDSLEASLAEIGLSWQFHLKFSDHYPYKENTDQLLIKKYARLHQLDYIITTEKDYTKLCRLHLNAPLAVLRIEFYLLSGELPDII